MSKKHFIALADALIGMKPLEDTSGSALAMTYWRDTLDAIAGVCYRSNPNFNRERWLAYIAGECGPNGGKS